MKERAFRHEHRIDHAVLDEIGKIVGQSIVAELRLLSRRFFQR